MATARRRPLTNVGGAVEHHGDPALAQLLGAAFDDAGRLEADTLTHGFHSYPARLHPALAARLIAELTRVDDVVFDPFAGGGTVVVEALAAGRRAFGADLNPLAVRIGEVRCALTDRTQRRQLGAQLRQVALRSEEHVRARDDIRAKLPREEIAWYSGHTLRELAGLRHEIAQLDDPFARTAFELVFSAIVVKFSLQRSDTAEEKVERRIRKGLPTEFFLRKGEELIERWNALRQAVPPRTPAAKLRVADAREPQLGRQRAALVLSSPPYGGTYDYRAHHARRYPWLGLDTRELEQGELGARRRFQAGDFPAALERWDKELGESLWAAAQQIGRGGSVVWLLGDGQLAGRRVEARDQVARLAPHCGLQLVASASQRRLDRQGGAPRREHLFLLRQSR